MRMPGTIIFLVFCWVYGCCGANDDHLLAYWSFDTLDEQNFIEDLSGNGHVAQIVSSDAEHAPGCAMVEGFLGQAVRCSTISGHGTFVLIPSFALPEGPFSITAWVKPDGGWTQRIIYQKPSPTSSRGLDLQFSGDRLQLLFQTTGRKEDRRVIESRLPVKPQFWSFLAIVWDGASWCLYVNGHETASGSGDDYPWHAAGTGVPMRLGGTGRSHVNTFRGLIDEVRVWSRAFDADGIESLMLNDVSRQ